MHLEAGGALEAIHKNDFRADSIAVEGQRRKYLKKITNYSLQLN